MNKTLIHSLAACAIALLALPACNRAESPSKVAGDVAEAQTDRAMSVADAQADQAKVQAETIPDAHSGDPDDRGDAIAQRAKAQYDTTVAAAKGDFDVAKQGCEALQGDAQAICKKKADATYEAAKNNAQLTLDMEQKRGDQTQKLDNR
jgi:hypothetical protein